MGVDHGVKMGLRRIQRASMCSRAARRRFGDVTEEERGASYEGRLAALLLTHRPPWKASGLLASAPTSVVNGPAVPAGHVRRQLP